MGKGDAVDDEDILGAWTPFIMCFGDLRLCSLDSAISHEWNKPTIKDYISNVIFEPIR